ncbi:MAG: CbrC family protein [Alphaproteobacteria bacterium]|nr:CbrC family protein [Alphaproteobacteria bacterium]MBL6940343.1 CbrC family protein [Alphaproteobacteria bacterium]MBL7098199.1 CbrC family protein [Alphaproteobacteria bacterium]
MTLPHFKYHPDPLASGSIKLSEAVCVCCERARGYVYDGAPYAEADDLEDAICPWCIADGSAHAKFDATFADDHHLVGKVPDAVTEEVTQRTPGFSSWQTEEWLTCCNDACAFLEPVGTKETEARYPAALPILRAHFESAWGMDAEEAETMCRSLHRDGSPTAYIFQCLHCRTLHAYADCD